MTYPLKCTQCWLPFWPAALHRLPVRTASRAASSPGGSLPALDSFRLPYKTNRSSLESSEATTRRKLAAVTLATGTAALGSKPKVVVITGPTAVGKTNISLSLAEALDGEIISADSVQVYRGLDIGSDKISVSERRGIPHHLLDVIEPSQDFSAGDFYERARAATQDILQRGKLPIIVGGTGFYLRWYIHGKPNTPTSSPEIAAKVQQFIDQTKAAAVAEKGPLSDVELWEVYAKAVEALGDSASANRLRSEVNNQYRLSRMLEILLTTGKPLADFNHDRAAPLDFDFRCFFLNRPRIQLYDRIGLRCEQMLEKGLLKEAKWLLDQGCEAGTNCATKSIGYRQALEFLQACRASQKPPGGDSLVQLAKDIQAKSRNLCHHQLSWFRDEVNFRWIDTAQDQQEVVRELLQRIGSETHEGKQEGVGILTKEEGKALRGYIYKQQLVSQPEVQERILRSIEWDF